MTTKAAALSLSDVLGLGRLAAEAAEGVTGIVEQMHDTLLDTPGLAPLARGVTGGVTRLVYRGVRGAFRLTGAGSWAAAALRPAKPDDGPVSRGGRWRSRRSTASSATISRRPAIRWR